MELDKTVVERAQLDGEMDWLRVGDLHPETLSPLSHDGGTLQVAQILAEIGGGGAPQLRCVRQPGGAAVHLCLGRADARRGRRWMDWVLAQPGEGGAAEALRAFFEQARAAQERGVMLGAAARADRQYVGSDGRPAFFFHIEDARHVTPASPREEDVLSRDMLHFLAGAHTSPAFRDAVFASFQQLEAMTAVGRVGGVRVLSPFGPLCRSMDAGELAELAATGAVLELPKATIAHGAQLPSPLLDLCAQVQRAAAGADEPQGVVVRLLGGRVDVAAERKSMAEGVAWIGALSALYPTQFAKRRAEGERDGQEEQQEGEQQEGEQRDGQEQEGEREGGSRRSRGREGEDVFEGPISLRVPARRAPRPRVADFLEALAAAGASLHFTPEAAF